jgi:hypothetical protein
MAKEETMCKEYKRRLLINVVMALCAGILCAGCVTTQGNLVLPYEGTVSRSGIAFKVVNTGTGDGIAGETYGGEGSSGVQGRANHYGGRFVANGNIGIGVYGEASHIGNERNHGGYFKASSKAGIGAYGESSGTSGTGVFGLATDTGDVNNFGGVFEARGVYGKAVVGVASNDSEMTNYGGHFVAKGRGGRGIYAEGGPQGSAAAFKGKIIIGNRNTGEFVMILGDDGKLTTRVLEITGGSDLSEKFQIGTAMDVTPTAGMVVIIDPDNPGKLAVSSEPYDRRIAGIISGAGNIESGMIMGQSNSAADGEHPVALIGRVYCLADASNGSIQPGDLLTTSDIPGHAMKVTDHTRAQGAILGKAMTRLESGRGLVLVLVNLQ